jgi:hypothetical protein
VENHSLQPGFKGQPSIPKGKAFPQIAVSRLRLNPKSRVDAQVGYALENSTN